MKNTSEKLKQRSRTQKTANGWVKPKSGGAGKGSAENKTAGVAEWEESAKTEAKRYNENMVILQNEKGETTAVRESSPDVEKAESKGYKKMSLVRPDGSVKKHQENNSESKLSGAAEKNKSHPMVGMKFNPKEKETEMKWSDGETHITYTKATGVGHREEGTRRALVVREDKNGNGVYAVINFNETTGKINSMDEYKDEEEAESKFDEMLGKRVAKDSAPHVLTGDTKIRIKQ